MRADEAVESGLTVGMDVFTYPMGAWPGGVARVTEIAPDSAAPEIAFNVVQGDVEIGVFEYEQIILLKPRGSA